MGGHTTTQRKRKAREEATATDTSDDYPDAKFWIERYIESMEESIRFRTRLLYLMLFLFLSAMGYNVSDYIGLIP